MILQCTQHRAAFHCALLLHRDEMRRLGQSDPDVQTVQRENGTDQERYPPAPFAQCRLRDEVGGQRGHPGRDQDSEPDAGEMQRADQATPFRRGVLDEEGCGTLEFATRRKALQQSREQQQQRRGDANRGVGWCHCGDQAAGTHQQYGQRQHSAPAVFVGQRR